MYTPEKITGYDVEDFVFRSFNQDIICRQEWEQRAIDYNWKNKDYDIHLKELYDCMITRL
jgi:hypothetical protein